MREWTTTALTREHINEAFMVFVGRSIPGDFGLAYGSFYPRRCCSTPMGRAAANGNYRRNILRPGILKPPLPLPIDLEPAGKTNAGEPGKRQ